MSGPIETWAGDGQICGPMLVTVMLASMAHRADNVTAFEQSEPADPAIASSAAAAIAKIVGQDVVAGVMERLELRQEIDLEAAEVALVLG